MRIKGVVFFSLWLVTAESMAAQSIYCPQNHGYINVGMTTSQVLGACGQPLSKKQSDQVATQKVPVKQLLYTTLNPGSIYPGLDPIYNAWSLPSGSTGIALEVDITNNKVSGIRINGSDTNAMSMCGGINVQMGDDENRVYNACGNPSMINNTYLNQPMPSTERPEVWIYQVDQYQAPITLTFLNGKLQSID